MRSRQRDDYQRPIIDKLANDANYTGLWEIVHVKAQSGYVPDSIKSWKTLEAAIDASKFSVQRTLKVINCPVIEEATWVVPRHVFRQAQPRPPGGGHPSRAWSCGTAPSSATATWPTAWR